jgi:hypothetical protein
MSYLNNEQSNLSIHYNPNRGNTKRRLKRIYWERTRRPNRKLPPGNTYKYSYRNCWIRNQYHCCTPQDFPRRNNR